MKPSNGMQVNRDAAFDVTGIGNAIVDIVATVSDDFIERHQLPRGGMTLIDDERAAHLYSEIGPALESSGGSVANTIAGLASLGARCCFLGKVNADQLGTIFQHDLETLGVNCPLRPTTGLLPTASCLVLVTRDAQRTMATFLGAAAHFGPLDVDEQAITAGRIVYLEGYLFDRPLAKEAFRRARDLARQAQRKVALTLSDRFCVERHREDFLAFIREGVDVLFANEAEMLALLGSTDIESMRMAFAGGDSVVALTRGDRGSIVITHDQVHVVAPEPVDEVLDTTGAGDLYASGFLFGLSQEATLQECGTLGSVCAAEALTHFGARPALSLKALVAGQGARIYRSFAGVSI